MQTFLRNEDDDMMMTVVVVDVHETMELVFSVCLKEMDVPCV